MNNFLFFLENGLINLCFLVLLMTTLAYWVQISWKIDTKSIGSLGLLCANFLLLASLLLRWLNSHHFPLSNLYGNNKNL